MLWKFSLTPNQNEWRKNLVVALVGYCTDRSDVHWDLVKYYFREGWAEQYQKENNQ